jgi:hypothetical protein
MTFKKYSFITQMVRRMSSFTASPRRVTAEGGIRLQEACDRFAKFPYSDFNCRHRLLHVYAHAYTTPSEQKIYPHKTTQSIFPSAPFSYLSRMTIYCQEKSPTP